MTIVFSNPLAAQTLIPGALGWQQGVSSGVNDSNIFVTAGTTQVSFDASGYDEFDDGVAGVTLGSVVQFTNAQPLIGPDLVDVQQV